MSKAPNTLFDKVWDAHVVRKIEDGPDILLIDRHFIHEVTSPVAFLGLDSRKLTVRSGESTVSFLLSKPRNATGLVTSCIKWRSIRRISGPSSIFRTTWASHTLSNKVFGALLIIK